MTVNNIYITHHTVNKIQKNLKEKVLQIKIMMKMSLLNQKIKNNYLNLDLKHKILIKKNYFNKISKKILKFNLKNNYSDKFQKIIKIMQMHNLYFSKITQMLWIYFPIIIITVKIFSNKIRVTIKIKIKILNTIHNNNNLCQIKCKIFNNNKCLYLKCFTSYDIINWIISLLIFFITIYI